MKDNKLIAEFMGLQFSNRMCYPQYHTSWDWLMPVVREVIVRYQIDLESEIDFSELESRVMDNDIERAYEEVVEFIKQYKKYPFNEGDDYWVEEDGDLVWGCWDDVSEELHDENPNRQYFTEEEVMDHIRANGVKLYKR